MKLLVVAPVICSSVAFSVCRVCPWTHQCTSWPSWSTAIWRSMVSTQLQMSSRGTAHRSTLYTHTHTHVHITVLDRNRPATVFQVPHNNVTVWKRTLSTCRVFYILILSISRFLLLLTVTYCEVGLCKTLLYLTVIITQKLWFIKEAKDECLQSLHCLCWLPQIVFTGLACFYHIFSLAFVLLTVFLFFFAK